MNEEFLSELGLSDEQKEKILEKNREERISALLQANKVRSLSAAMGVLNCDNVAEDESLSYLKENHPYLFEDGEQVKFTGPAEGSENEESSFRRALGL